MREEVELLLDTLLIILRVNYGIQDAFIFQEVEKSLKKSRIG